MKEESDIVEGEIVSESVVEDETEQATESLKTPKTEDENYDLLVLIRDQLNAPEALTEVRRASVKLEKEDILKVIAETRKNN